MNQLELFGQIKVFLFDVDGVMTNNQILVLENGELARSMNVRDGYALQKAVAAGYAVAVISGGKSASVKTRLQALGITDIYLGVRNKLEAYQELLDLYDWDAQSILYLGDDLPDHPVMRRVGLPACPSDAVPEIMQMAVYVSPYGGGQGCVRDVIEKVMRLQGKWPED